MRYFLFLIGSFLLCQTLSAQTTPGSALAERMATKMKDSLQLTAHQKGQLLKINLQLNDKKKKAWQQYGVGTDSLRQKLQGIEGMRDSLYRPVLSQSQYEGYRQKKNMLISTN